MRERSDCGTDDDRRRGFPEVESEEDDGDRSDEDGRKLEVGRDPDEKDVERLSVSLPECYVFHASRLDGGDLLAVVALSNRYVLLYFLGRLHRRFPLNKRRRLLTPEV